MKKLKKQWEKSIKIGEKMKITKKQRERLKMSEKIEYHEQMSKNSGNI